MSFFNQTIQGNVQLFEEFPHQQTNKHRNTTFKIVMSKKKVNK